MFTEHELWHLELNIRSNFSLPSRAARDLINTRTLVETSMEAIRATLHNSELALIARIRQAIAIGDASEALAMLELLQNQLLSPPQPERDRLVAEVFAGH